MNEWAITWAIRISKELEIAYAGVVKVTYGEQGRYAISLKHLSDLYFRNRPFSAALAIFAGEGEPEVLFDKDVPPLQFKAKYRKTISQGEQVLLDREAEPVAVRWPHRGAAGFVAVIEQAGGHALIWHLGPMWLLDTNAARSLYRYLFPIPARSSIQSARSRKQVLQEVPGAAWTAFNVE